MILVPARQKASLGDIPQRGSCGYPGFVSKDFRNREEGVAENRVTSRVRWRWINSELNLAIEMREKMMARNGKGSGGEFKWDERRSAERESGPNARAARETKVNEGEDRRWDAIKLRDEDAQMMSVDMSEAQTKEKESSPDVGVPLHVEVVEVVGALRSTEVGSLQPLDDLVLHHPGDVSRQ